MQPRGVRRQLVRPRADSSAARASLPVLPAAGGAGPEQGLVSCHLAQALGR